MRALPLVKSFCVFWFGIILCILHTLIATGAEDRALLGSNLSAGSGAKTRLGAGKPSCPQRLSFCSTGIGIKAVKSQGAWGDGVPQGVPSFLRAKAGELPCVDDGFVESAHWLLRSFVVTMYPPSTSA